MYEQGTPIYATGDGVVEVADASAQGYGNHVVIRHGFGYETLYGHLSKYKCRAGQKVKRGDVIGYVGSTGRSEAPHLHYEVMKNTCIPSGNISKERVNLEIYYQKGHEYNLKRMMESMKMSLDYYSKHFSPYQYKQIRIVEFPRYRTFAQSLPGIIPFSEALGFVMNIDDKKDVDMAFYVTAHEVAHQWWGLQLEAANVQGQNMILETLAQYSAIMVLKAKYSDKKVQQFLKFQLDEYAEAQLKSSKKELPLALVENEEHIYYNKGAIAMYQLQQQIGETNVNKALQNFLNDWRSFNKQKKLNRYATTLDLIQYFRRVTPNSKQNVISDLFERVKHLELAIQ